MAFLIILLLRSSFPLRLADGFGILESQGTDGKYAVHCCCHDDIHTKETSPLPCNKPSWETEWSKDKLVKLYSDCNPVYVLSSVGAPTHFTPRPTRR